MIHVFTDFSKTLTHSNTPTTWSALALSGVLGSNYAQKRDQLFNKNYQYELQGNIQKTHDWFASHLQLMVNSGLTQDHINSLMIDQGLFPPRKGLSKFTSYCERHNIQITIISSGISNFILSFLQYHKINTANITIIGNTLTTNSSGKIDGYDPLTVFCPLESKAQFEDQLYVDDNDIVFLLGDKPEDLEMYDKSFKTIGFNDTHTGFDINFGKQGSLSQVISEIQKIL